MTPIIGLTLDHEEGGGYSRYPWYALRENYAGCVTAAGGVPVALPHGLESVAPYLDLMDGLIVTGGDFDVDPALFGATETHAKVSVKAGRTAFELALLRGAMDRDMPVLGICGGMQLLAVALGGTLIQHIPDAHPDALPHEQPNPRHEPGHTVTLDPASKLAGITGPGPFPVNSAHHQAVESMPAAMRITAHAPDGIIEAIEDPAKRFCIGVQWHPEFTISPADAALLKAFVAACGDMP